MQWLPSRPGTIMAVLAVLFAPMGQADLVVGGAADPAAAQHRMLEIQRKLAEKNANSHVPVQSSESTPRADNPATGQAEAAQDRALEIQRRLAEKAAAKSSGTAETGAKADGVVKQHRDSAVGPSVTSPMSTPAPLKADDAQRKIDFVRMMIKGKGTARIEASTNPDAIATLTQAKMKFAAAEQAYQTDQSEQAMTLADEALKLYHSASRMVPSDSVLAQHKSQFEEHKRQLDAAVLSHRNNYDRVKRTGGKVVEVDQGELKRLGESAQQAATKGQYVQAGNMLKQAQTLVQQAIKAMLNEQTIVYELDLSSPEKEYAYERERYLGYEELIPVAFDRRLPSEEQKAQIKVIVDKSHWMSNEADKVAKSGDYPSAIRMVLDATNHIKGAFRIMGINQ